MNIYHIFGLFFFSTILCLFFIPLLKFYAPRWGLIDKPSDRRIHTTSIPRCGGIAVFIASHVTIGLSLLLFPDSSLYKTVSWLEIFIGSLAIFIIGILDDKYSLSAWIKLGGQLIVSIFMFHKYGEF